MKAMATRTALAALCLGLTGCVYLRTQHVLTGTPAPPVAGEIKVVLEGAPIPDGLNEIALLQSVGSGPYADLEHVIAGLRSEARALGCNYVVRVRIDQGQSLASGSGVCGRTADAR